MRRAAPLILFLALGLTAGSLVAILAGTGSWEKSSQVADTLSVVLALAGLALSVWVFKKEQERLGRERTELRRQQLLSEEADQADQAAMTGPLPTAPDDKPDRRAIEISFRNGTTIRILLALTGAVAGSALTLTTLRGPGSSSPPPSEHPPTTPAPGTAPPPSSTPSPTISCTSAPTSSRSRSAAPSSSGPSSSDPTASGTSTRAGVRVTFSKPPRNGPCVTPGEPVRLEGTVAGLPEQHKLWILARPIDPDDQETSYFVVGDFPVATSDGEWHVTNYSTGDDTDRGKYFEFSAVDAAVGAGTCDQLLTEAASANGDERRVTFDLERYCTVLQPAAVVRFTG